MERLDCFDDFAIELDQIRAESKHAHTVGLALCRDRVPLEIQNLQRLDAAK
jgi:hypothetical protein